jgi:lipid II:glycine glycyltransferase (peptidoglycan interpeptide bridge formation enzyme)
MPIDFVLLDHLDDPVREAFDRFVCDSRHAAYQQVSCWARLQGRQGRARFRYYLQREHGQLIGTALIREVWLSPVHWMAKVVRGPIVQDIARLGQVIAGLKQALAAAGCCSIQLAPRVRGRDVALAAETIRVEGGMPLPLSQQALHVSTGIVWLDKPEEAILAGFKQRARRQLRKSEKSGLTVRVVDPGNEDDIAVYQQLLDQFYASKPLYSSRDLPDARGQAALVAQLTGAMLIAQVDGMPIGGHCFVRQGREAIWLSLPTLDHDPSVPRAYGLIWEGMRAARALGCVGYDLAGLPLDMAHDEASVGRVQFKRSFNPHQRIMVPANAILLKPLAHTLLYGARRSAAGVRRLLQRRTG